jgi:hypothetical protein
LLSVLTTDQKGIVAETNIAAVALAAGVGVAKPLGDERYDLIFDLGDRLLRIQCKWAVRDNDVVVVRCRRVRRGRYGLIRRQYLPGEIDAIVGYCAGTERCYYLPQHMSVERAAVQLRLAPTLNNQARGINWAQDFELGATLRTLRGPIAQLGEHLSGRQKVAGSSPAGSTDKPPSGRLSLFEV